MCYASGMRLVALGMVLALGVGCRRAPDPVPDPNPLPVEPPSAPPAPLPGGEPQTNQGTGPATQDGSSGTAPGSEAPSPTAPPPGKAFEGTAGRTERKREIAQVAQLRGVRAARHEGFDRVVFEFAEALPGYEIEYIDRPVRACGSGHVVPLAGDGWLEIRFHPARSHTDEGKPTIAERRQRPELPTVLELASTCDFEGYVTWVLGVGSPNRYRVLELSSPPRLAVDVLH